MSLNPNDKPADPRMDAATLYREEVITDRKVGTIRMLSPVKSDGTPDAARSVVYVGEAQIYTNMGPLPISFEIEAASVGEAAEKFGGLAKEAIERTVKDLQEMRRQASSSIVVPGMGGGMGGMGGGGLGGGGNIQIP
ncbi:MAG: hypothetical protein AABZ67_15835 [Pseudomonadota bacterium]